MAAEPQAVHSDPDIMSGVPVFVGTRVPFRTLIDYLGGGQPLDEFPSVSREHAVFALRQASETLTANVGPARQVA